MLKKQTIKNLFHRELLSWSLISFALSALEGGVAGVLVNLFFKDQVSDFWLSQAVALAAGAPAIANLSSPIWAQLEQGRDKVKLVAFLSTLSAFSVLLYALAPANSVGLLMAVLGSLLGRICWSGVLTVRSALWRANYPRYLRAKITAKLELPMSLILAFAGSLIGWLSAGSIENVRILYIVLISLGLLGANFYRGLEIKGAEKLALSEKNLSATEGGFSWKMLYSILKKDKPYRHYIYTMFIFGSGNLMFMAPLILIINDQLGIPQWQQVLITSSLPLAALPFTIHLWAKKLNHMHIIQYRAVHSWSFVAAIALFNVASIFDAAWLLWPASFTFGTAVAGAVLGWNLGHHDYTTPERASRYMAVHVTLTGVRGLIMPILGVNIYQWLKLYSSEWAKYTLLLPLLLSMMGALIFMRLAKHQKLPVLPKTA